LGLGTSRGNLGRRNLRLGLLLPCGSGRSGHGRQYGSSGSFSRRTLHGSVFKCRCNGPRSPITIAVTIPPFGARSASRLRLVAQAFARTTRKDFSLVDPALHANNAISGMGFAKTVINIGAQRVQRKLPLQVPFRTRDLSAVQAARHAYFDSLAAETQRRIDRLTHRP